MANYDGFYITGSLAGVYLLRGTSMPPEPINLPLFLEYMHL